MIASNRPLWGNGSGWLLAGPQGWDIAREWEGAARLFLLCPPDCDPAAFDWRQLVEVPPPVLLHAPGLSWPELERLAAHVLAAGVDRLLTINGKHNVILRGAE